tara:strand:- start:1754 stop:2212 length:459 start_codon:yes stop_codon:yes gene_type:complete
MFTVEVLFEKIIEVSKKKRLRNRSFDGKKFWQPIKEILSKSNWKANKWKTQSKKQYKLIMNIPEYYINGEGKKLIIEENHFLIQTVRIPNTDSPTLKKICQLALNIGQYQGYTKKNLENNNINSFLQKKDSNILLKDILDKEEIIKLKKILT